MDLYNFILYFRHMDIYKNDFCGKIITAECCIHNICISMNDDYSYDLLTSEVATEENTEEDTGMVALLREIIYVILYK